MPFVYPVPRPQPWKPHHTNVDGVFQTQKKIMTARPKVPMFTKDSCWYDIGRLLFVCLNFVVVVQRNPNILKGIIS